jgi:hypothetical protein
VFICVHPWFRLLWCGPADTVTEWNEHKLANGPASTAMTVVAPVALCLIDLHQDLPEGHASQFLQVHSMCVVQRGVVLEPGARGIARQRPRQASGAADLCEDLR